MFSGTHLGRARCAGPRGAMTTIAATALLALAGAAENTALPLEGRDANQRDSLRPKITAAFPRESYRPGQRARLTVYSGTRRLTLQFFRAGLEQVPTKANDVMLGAPVTPRIRIGAVRSGRVLRVTMGNWSSGVYFAELRAPGGRIGYAPFVLRPSRLGEQRVAVVIPTQTWQAYNFRDDDGDGVADTWYVQGNTARLGRPFLNRGVPPHFKYYDAPFLRWLARTGHSADYLSDADLSAVASGRRLAARYSLIVFPGHHEYVTAHEYDIVTGYRNRGGNLMFLSANNFFYEIRRRGVTMTRVGRWRDLGRPEAALIGVQYFDWDHSSGRRGPWIVRRSGATSWIFAGTGLRRGSGLSSGGIEADSTAPGSPRVRILAEIPDVFGDGRTAQMTYYERHGAKVFAAGAFTLAGSVEEPPARQIIENLWARLAADPIASSPPVR
jgi:hypothetical protein